MDDLIGLIATGAIFNHFFAWLLAIILVASTIFMVGFVVGTNSAETQALERGYMEFCTTDGSQVWLGECDG